MDHLTRHLGFCLASLLLVAPLNANSWTLSTGCEGDALGGNMYWGTGTSLSTAQSAGGSQSCRLEIVQGSEGWPSSGGPLEFGAIVSFPAPVRVGADVWVRLKLFVPDNFDVSTDMGMLKFIRLHTKSSEAYGGYLDLFFGTGGIPLWNPKTQRDEYPPYVVGFEGRGGLSFIGSRPGHDIAEGRWEAYEVNVRVGTSSSDGRVRFWKNNVLVAEIPQASAMAGTDVLESMYLFTYWNGRSPKTQHLFVDDIEITNEVPSNRDEHGYPFIGGAIAGDAVAPRSPTKIEVR